MIVEHLVPVPWQKQKKGYYCGPACIAMVLKSRQVPAPSQPTLWTKVKDNTFGNRPESAPHEPGWFDSQVCFKCGNWQCWFTTPEALSAVVNAGLGGGTHTVHYASSQASGTDRVITALKAHTAPCLTLNTMSHWVVISGVQLEKVTKNRITTERFLGAYVEDPQASASAHAQSITRFRGEIAWLEDFAALTCGPYKDNYVVVTD
jgi:hypothetical protein